MFCCVLCIYLIKNVWFCNVLESSPKHIVFGAKQEIPLACNEIDVILMLSLEHGFIIIFSLIFKLVRVNFFSFWRQIVVN